jgi:predicted ATP-dependent endonuclease of OLD family
MGAEAAAFSAINRALLTEGVSEMILLPTLLRAVSPNRRIDFQVSFGLSNMSIPKDLGNVALQTTYLVDGDSEGTHKLAKLRRLGIPDVNLLQLPPGKAIEDLIARDCYLDAVDAVIEETGGGGSAVERDRLDAQQTIAKAVDLLEKTVDGFKAPGHKVVAARVAANPEILELSPEGTSYLRDELWPSIEAAFAAPYEIG